MAAKKATTRRKKVSEFKVPAGQTYGNPERLGKALMRCIEYIESIGQYATMVGEEDRTCINTLLKGADSYSRKNRRQLDVILKPDMYDGRNGGVRQALSTPDVGGEQFKFDLPNSTNPEEFLHADYGYYELLAEHGYRMSFTEAVVRFFLLNPDATPEQNFCTSIGVDGETQKYSCLSDIIEMTRSAGVDSPYDRPEVLPEVIKMINNPAMCVNVRRPRLSQFKYFPTVLMPCLEKLVEISEDAILTTDADRNSVRHYIHRDHSYATKFDEYDWNVKSTDGQPVIQKFMNACSHSLGGNNLATLVAYLMVDADASERSAFVSTLSEDYDFKNISLEGEYPTLLDGSTRMTGIDYAASTGILLVEISRSNLLGSIFLDQPLCRYDDTDSMYSCFAKISNNMQELFSRTGLRGMRSEDDIKRLFNVGLSDSVTQAMFERGTREGDCSMLTGTPSIPYTCADVFINTVARIGYPSVFTEMLRHMDSEYPIAEMTCSDERNGGRSTTCLDKLISTMTTSTPLQVLADSGVLLSYPDCSDSNGNKITCIDKMAQRHELWVYAKYRARQLRTLRDVISNEGNDSEDRAYVETLTSEFNEAIFDMNISGDTGFRAIMDNYDIGSIKSHVPTISTESFKKVLRDDIESVQRLSRYGSFVSLGFTPDRMAYTRELLKAIEDGTSRDYPIVSRIMKMYDADHTLFSTYADYASLGITGLLSDVRTEPLSFNVFECKDSASGKTISCMQKLIDVSQDVKTMRKSRDKQPSGYKDEFASLFAMRDMYKPESCDAPDGSRRSCFEYVFEKSINSDYPLDMSVYVAIMSNRDFAKYADNVIHTAAYGDKTLREIVCKNVTLFDLGHYLVTTRTLGRVGNNRPRFDHQAAALHSICSGCDKITDPLDKRICIDKDIFSEHGGFLADRDLNHTTVNEKGQEYGGYSYSDSKWANEYAKDPESNMSSFRYGGSDDLFGLAGVYKVTFDPDKVNVGGGVQVDRFDYKEVVLGTVYPAIRRTIGKTLSRFKKFYNVTIQDFDMDTSNMNNFMVTAFLDVSNENGERSSIRESYTIPEMFAKGGLLSSDDMKRIVKRSKQVVVALNRLATMKSSKAVENTFTLVISNRPADFMRASTGQPWTSCNAFRNYPGLFSLNRALVTKLNLGGYIAYAAGNELDIGWKARMILVPGMDVPNETDKNGNVTNIFRIEAPYGLPTYREAMQAALGIILREHGYNYVGSYDSNAHGGKTLPDYIYNSNGYGKGRLTRRGGEVGSTGGFGSGGGTRRNMLVGEIWTEATERCIAKVLSGESFVVVDRDEGDEIDVNTSDDCDFFGNETHKNSHGVYVKEPSESLMRSMFSNGLISKDLDRNYRFTFGTNNNISFFIGYDGVLDHDMQYVLTEIPDVLLNTYKEKVSVQLIKPLSTVRGREAVVNG